MNKILEQLYDSYANGLIDNYPFITPEIREKTDTFLDAYFSNMTDAEKDNVLEKFFEITGAVEKNAFAVGFNAAVQLLMGGGLS